MIYSFLALMIVPMVSFSSQEQIRVDLQEEVDQVVIYNPLNAASGIWTDSNENQSEYNITGYITVTIKIQMEKLFLIFISL